jgi:cell division protein FtsB
MGRMSAEDRAQDVARLRQQLVKAEAERTRLAEEIANLTARIPEIRAAFGNPFYYSHPEYPDEGIAN